ncbi:hypothetical protein HPB47_017519 [Ixodes persulcatus]|uniref:Uncharacterized protein n=1 Tax=Ixodes persulcatus TaxID=34615 RepID=A0AC60QP11_IXOPE|nr:hypothetical protein HPB47_017519 [Ixodes persulcatus]
MHRMLTKLGFKYKKWSRNALLIEATHIVQWLCKYLRQMSELRRQKKNIFYSDETWVSIGHTVGQVWVDTDVTSTCEAKHSGLSTGLRNPTGKGGRLIVTPCGNANGVLRPRVPQQESSCAVRNSSPGDALSPVKPSSSPGDPDYVAMGARPKRSKTGCSSGPPVSGRPAALGAGPRAARHHTGRHFLPGDGLVPGSQPEQDLMEDAECLVSSTSGEEQARKTKTSSVRAVLASGEGDVTPGGAVTHVVQQPQRSRSPFETPGPVQSQSDVAIAADLPATSWSQPWPPNDEMTAPGDQACTALPPARERVRCTAAPAGRPRDPVRHPEAPAPAGGRLGSAADVEAELRSLLSRAAPPPRSRAPDYGTLLSRLYVVST